MSDNVIRTNLYIVCCIYHKPHAIGESSESESSSDSDNSSSSEDERPHINGKCTHKHPVQKKRRNPREVSPNAYERQPVYKGMCMLGLYRHIVLR